MMAPCPSAEQLLSPRAGRDRLLRTCGLSARQLILSSKFVTCISITLTAKLVIPRSSSLFLEEQSLQTLLTLLLICELE